MDFQKYCKAKGISTSEACATIHAVCPKFTRIHVCNISNPDYGVRLTLKAQKALTNKYGKLERKKHDTI